MEYLDVYNENHEFIGTYPRDVVHLEGMWHNTIHCWLYDDEGNVYFQIRSDAGKFYTSASGHVKAGEALNEAFGREVEEELGIKVNYDEAQKIDVVVWKMDKEKNGVVIKDRAFANVYILKVLEDELNFTFPDGEVVGVCKVKARDALDLFKGVVDQVSAQIIMSDSKEDKMVNKEDFLLMPGENLMQKYGSIMEAIREK